MKLNITLNQYTNRNIESYHVTTTGIFNAADAIKRKSEVGIAYRSAANNKRNYKCDYYPLRDMINLQQKFPNVEENRLTCFPNHA